MPGLFVQLQSREVGCVHVQVAALYFLFNNKSLQLALNGSPFGEKHGQAFTDHWVNIKKLQLGAQFLVVALFHRFSPYYRVFCLYKSRIKADAAPTFVVGGGLDWAS